MLHKATGDKHLAKVRGVMKRAGYSTGGQNHSMKKVAKKEAAAAVKAHEKHDHPNKPLTKLKTGGVAEGKKAKERLDKCSRGGKPKGGSHVHVNVIVPQAKKDAMSAAMGGNMPPKPPMPLPAAGAMPGGAAPTGAPAGVMPPRPPMSPGVASNAAPRPSGMKSGGKASFKGATKANVGSDYDAGAGNGIGRMEKENKYGDDFKVAKKKDGGEVAKPKDKASRFGYVSSTAEEEGKEVRSKNGKVVAE